MKETKKNLEPVRDKTGKFKKAIEPQPEALAAEAEEEARPLQPVRVTGAGCKSAKFQTGHLKWIDGEALPELEGEEENE